MTVKIVRPRCTALPEPHLSALVKERLVSQHDFLERMVKAGSCNNYEVNIHFISGPAFQFPIPPSRFVWYLDEGLCGSRSETSGDSFAMAVESRRLAPISGKRC